MPELDSLRTFLAAARLGSFAGAGRQLNLSPAMVGRRIQGLETLYGIKLIERTTRSQRLTEDGLRFLQRAEAVLDAAEALAECGNGGGGIGGRIRVSAPTTLGIRRLPAIVARFSAAHPDVVFEMVLSDRRVDLVAEGFDMAVRVGSLQPSTLVARRVGTYGFVCCAAPDFLQSHGTPGHPEELVRSRCILNLNLIPRNRWSFVHAGGETLTVEVRGGIEIDNGEAQRMLALDGAGVVYLPLDLVAEDLAEGRLVQLFPDWQMPGLPIHTLHPSRHLVPRRLSAFLDAVAEGFRR